ncbi:GNAT family N-acetyltransferase [Sutcliffiella horikoshii]|uniref:GNAT family N-acetyltransferase n=1 Tax=Sutcliffiella horikoshii TaxID=79883 RepID=UPI001F240BCA|nr:GNAT family N-acetyltransferase [Sutcliffiella horikoshii]MCG1022863.1 GNAT family N-acetyltransferase [Sutcliffiella horikoshii]
MIIELEKEDFYKCRDILHENGLIEVKAIIEGINTGRVFVDDQNVPTTGFVWLGNNDGFIFFGNEANLAFNQELNSFIEGVIKPEAAKVGLKWFEALGDHADWHKSLERTFQHRPLGSWNQRVYQYKGKFSKIQKGCTLDDRYKVHKLDSYFYANNQAINMERMVVKVLESWSSMESSFKSGIGYCITYENKIVSSCFSVFTNGDIHSIAIETAEEHRGKKLAQHLTYHFINACVDANKIPYWDCVEQNKASIAVAEACGFEMVYRYGGSEFPIHP